MKKQWGIVVMVFMLFMGFLMPNMNLKAEEDVDLGPDQLQTMVSSMSGNRNALNAYATSIVEQQNIDLSGITTIDSQLKMSISAHQLTARDNAWEWMHTLNPHITTAIRSVGDYNGVFRAHYDNLVTAATNKDKEQLRQELMALNAEVKANQKVADDLVLELMAFRNKVAVDTQNFQGDANIVSTIMMGQDQGIPLMQQHINQLNGVIKQANTDIGIGAGLCATGILCAIGGPMIAEAKKRISSANQQITQLNQQINTFRAEASKLADVQSKVTNLQQQTSTVVDAVQNISLQWHTISAKYDSLITNVDKIDPERFAFIKSKINTARASWQDLESYVTALQ